MASGFKTIKEQDDVLNSKGKNIAISASAGSGKTSVMIRKIVKLIIEENVKIEDLLVLTYTNSASSEMKQKLVSEITKTGNIELIKQLDNIATSDISTFDSFCQKLVKKYFYLLDIDPAFNILQGSEETQIRTKSIKNAIKLYKKTNFNDFSVIFDFYGSNRTDKKIKEIILKINDFSRSILSYENFKQKALELFLPIENPKASEMFLKNIQDELYFVKKKLDDLFLLSKNLGYTSYCEYINLILSGIDLVLNSQDIGQAIEKINTFSIDKKFTRKKQDDSVYFKIKVLKDRWNFVLGKIKEFGSKDDYQNSLQVCQKTTQMFFDLYEKFVQEYDKIKSKKNLFDYNDIERLTLKLFGNEDILQETKSKYKHIFVDEFQDANRVQEKLINYLKTDNNLFLVGDLKQAIYGFRQSNSKIFENIISMFEKDEKSEFMKLNCNFRTTHQILEFVNAIFSVVMTNKTAKLDYKDKSMLIGQGDFQQEQSPCVELNILYNEKEENEAITQVYSVKENQDNCFDEDLASANFVAERITKLLSEKIYDINQKCYRKIEYKDIAILIRSRTKQQTYIQAFNNYNIPVLENSNTNLDETFDATVLTNLIKVSVNPKDDISLASVMMSNLFNFSADEMLTIRTSCIGEQTFFDCVTAYDGDKNLKQKIENMQEKISEFSQNCKFQSLSFALNRILEQTNYEYHIKSEFNGLSRAKNVRDYVNSFTNSNYNHSACEYLNFMRDNVREQKVVGAISSNNVVTITTMHSSKGLEWPVVIIPELSASFNTNTFEPEIVLNEEIGMGLKYYDNSTRQKFNSVFYSIVKTYNRLDDVSERLRLLYVALTRPKNRLILVGQTDKLEYQKFENDWDVINCSNYLSQIICSLNADDIAKINANQNNFNFLGTDDFVCNVINQNCYQNIEYENNIKIDNNIYSESDIQILANYIKKPYFNIEATLVAEKNSVSSILREDDEYASKNFEPKKLLISEDKKASVAQNELGSLYHKILECYDFSLEVSIAKIKQTISKIKSAKLFDDKVFDALNLKIIYDNLCLLCKMSQNFVALKEQTFVMQIPYSEIHESKISDKVLVQGVCDLILIGKDKTILIDYKYSSLNANNLTEKYYEQLYLYKKAAEYALNRKVDECYILSLKDAQLLSVKVSESVINKGV